MKAFFLILMLVSFSVAYAQIDTEEINAGEAQKEVTEDPYTGDSDYYRADPEVIRYYSGGYIGNNIIVGDNKNNREVREDPYSGDSDYFRAEDGNYFPEVIRYYSGGHRGTNIINEKQTEKSEDRTGNFIDDPYRR